jgi:hypothetical protein
MEPNSIGRFYFYSPINLYTHPRGANYQLTLQKMWEKKKPRYLLKYYGIKICNLFGSIGDIQREPMGTRGLSLRTP